MDSFATWMLKGLHAKQDKTRLSQISKMIDLTPFAKFLKRCKTIKARKVEDQTAMS